VISLDKPYSENIKQYPAYEKILHQFLETGVMEDKYMLILNSNDIQNLFVLGCLNVRDNKKPLYQSEMVSTYPYQNWILTDVGRNLNRLFELLPKEMGEKLLFSLGLEFIIDIGIDDLPAPTKSIMEVAKRRGLI
jgi:hypothetical protein